MIFTDLEAVKRIENHLKSPSDLRYADYVKNYLQGNESFIDLAEVYSETMAMQSEAYTTLKQGIQNVRSCFEIYNSRI